MKTIFLTLAILAIATTASANAVEGNPDYLPSISFYLGTGSSEGDWTSTSGDPSQDVEAKGFDFGTSFKFPVSKNVTLFGSFSRHTSTSKAIENIYYYGSETERSGWSAAGGFTIYLGS